MMESCCAGTKIINRCLAARSSAEGIETAARSLLGESQPEDSGRRWSISNLLPLVMFTKKQAMREHLYKGREGLKGIRQAEC